APACSLQDPVAARAPVVGDRHRHVRADVLVRVVDGPEVREHAEHGQRAEEQEERHVATARRSPPHRAATLANGAENVWFELSGPLRIEYQGPTPLCPS